MQALKDEVEYLRNERALLRKDLQEAAETVRTRNEQNGPSVFNLTIGGKVKNKHSLSRSQKPIRTYSSPQGRS